MPFLEIVLCLWLRWCPAWRSEGKYHPNPKQRKKSEMSILCNPAVAVLLVATLVVAVAAAEPDFKKMKIKEIRQWMDERGLVCPTCEEKADFVAFATKNAKTAPTNSRTKLEVPKEPFWEVWSKLAKETCTAVAEKKSVNAEESEKICSAIAFATDGFFMLNGKRTAGKLKKKPEALLKTSFGDVYYSAGKKLLNRLSSFCLNSKNRASCSSNSKVLELLEKGIKGVDFSMYITNIGIENTNPMYEIMKDRTANDEL
jgi:hypothetical protein